MNTLSHTSQVDPTTYRPESLGDLYSYRVKNEETDVYIRSERPINLRVVKQSIDTLRSEIKQFIGKYPYTLISLEPVWSLYDKQSSIKTDIVTSMLEASSKVGVGPMATVAGAIADHIGKAISKISGGIIIENGGDIYISMRRTVNVGMYTVGSPFGRRLYLSIDGTQGDVGICSSSGVIGHSFSFGRADCVSVIAESAALADAFATQLCNMISDPADIGYIMDSICDVPEIKGVVAIIGDHLGVFGDVQLGKIL